MIKKVINILIIAALAVSIFINFKIYKSSKSLAFIDTAYLFNNFKMKEELEVKFNENKKLKQRQLDSLYEIITTVKLSPQQNNIKALENEYLNKRKMVIEEQERLKASYDLQIWNQLNGYIKEYGDKNNIDLILGANGEGNIMHGNENMNISKELVDYANNKYNGK